MGFFVAIKSLLLNILAAGKTFLFGPVCCEAVGCFTNGPPFHGVSLPALLPLPLPQCPEILKIQMQLFTKINTVGEIVTRSTIPKTFTGSWLTIFIVHGWRSGITTKWLYTMKDEILSVGDYNVIIVSWDVGASNIIYQQSASDTRSVGAELALVINNLKKNGNSAASRLYCIGHSLVAYICGHAGNRTAIGRITGLDPAGPEFEHRDITAGLNPKSADLVDVIHTDEYRLLNINLGTMRVLGDVDFYPNGGLRQPGCFLINEMCSHHRAIDLYQESIRSPCSLVHQSCTNANNLPKSCAPKTSSAIQSMGFHANKYPDRGIFYLETNENPSFCRP